MPSTRAPFLPPRWFVRIAWVVHRRLFGITRGRRGLWPASADKWGTMRVTTVGRRTGRPRTAILGYFEDGPNVVTMAMNGWADPEPRWWLNLQARPEATIDLGHGPVEVSAHAAIGDERARLWTRWAHYDKALDAYAAKRSRQTQVVVFAPRIERPPAATA